MWEGREHGGGDTTDFLKARKMGGNRVYFCAELSRRNLIISKSLPWLVETLTPQPAQMLIYFFTIILHLL